MRGPAKHTDETKQKISAALKGRTRTFSEETKAKMSAAQTLKWQRIRAEQAAKQDAYSAKDDKVMPKPQTEKPKRKTGYIPTAEHIAKIVEAKRLKKLQLEGVQNALNETELSFLKSLDTEKLQALFEKNPGFRAIMKKQLDAYRREEIEALMHERDSLYAQMSHAENRLAEIEDQLAILEAE